MQIETTVCPCVGEEDKAGLKVLGILGHNRGGPLAVSHSHRVLCLVVLVRNCLVHLLLTLQVSAAFQIDMPRRIPMVFLITHAGLAGLSVYRSFIALESG